MSSGVTKSQGTVGIEQLEAALRLPVPLLDALYRVEVNQWAADINHEQVEQLWKTFMNRLESLLKGKKLKDEQLLRLIDFISTVDTVRLLDTVGHLDPVVRDNLLHLLNWLASSSEDTSRRVGAENTLERILMAFRMSCYRNVYSPERLARAVTIVQNQN